MPLILLFACSNPDDTAAPIVTGVDALSATLTEMPTVARVQWTTTDARRGTVTARFGERALVVEETEETTDHAVLLVGMPQRTDIAISVLLDGADEAEATTITTGSLPSWVPDVTVTADVPEAAAGGYTITPLITVTEGGVVVFDAEGRAVWAEARVDESATPVTRARLSLDGRAVLYGSTAADAETPGYIVRLPLDGGPATMAELTGSHTDFIELPDGGYAALGWELRTLDDGRTVVADTIVEVDPDGAQRTVWRAWDDYRPDPLDPLENHYPGDPDIPDWSHINSLTYDEASDDYYVTMTWNDGVARIDRGTGALLWTLSDTSGDYTNSGEGRLVWKPHTVQPIADGLLLFNREDPRDPESCSEATELVLDTTAGTAHRAAAWSSETCLLITFLGSAQRLDGGNTLVGWSTAGQIDEYTPDGALALRLSTAFGNGFGFSLRVPTLGDGRP